MQNMSITDMLNNAWNWVVTFFQDHPAIAFQLLIGLVAGWLASFILGGGGLFRDLIIGMIGSVLGSFLQAQFGFHFGLPALAEQIAVATVGALVVIVIGRVLFR